MSRGNDLASCLGCIVLLAILGGILGALMLAEAMHARGWL